MENRHIYRRLRNRIQPRPNNRPVLTAGIKQSSGKEVLEKKSTDKVKDMDTDKARSQSKAELVGNENLNTSSGGDTTRNDNDIGADNKAKQPSVIKRKFETNKIQPEFAEDKVNLTEKSDVKGFFMRKKGNFKNAC